MKRELNERFSGIWTTGNGGKILSQENIKTIIVSFTEGSKDERDDLLSVVGAHECRDPGNFISVRIMYLLVRVRCLGSRTVRITGH